MFKLILILFPLLIFAKSERKLDAIFHSLDPYSISEQFAFYHLYPQVERGQEALGRAWDLLNFHRDVPFHGDLILPTMDLTAIVSLVNRRPYEPTVVLNEDQLEVIEETASHLGNRKLKGYQVWTEEELIKLSSEETDLGRGLLIYQYKDADDAKLQIRQYEASLDLMALQILARLPRDAPHLEKIAAINEFIFHEMRFRFPPHSLYAKDIDLYTFLPSVLDSRQGVCLGVSIIYLCLAQRLDLPLEIITPPGHIYLRYGDVNIETTARGISLPSKTYLGINTRKLKERTLKEVIGLAFFNQASVAWHREDPETAIKLYTQAMPFLGDDPLLKMFLGYNYLFVGKIKEGKKLLSQISGLTFEESVYKETIAEDFLQKNVDTEGIQNIFLSVDEKRESIESKLEKIKKTLKKYPKFREGHFHLAIAFLQLSRHGEALEALKEYHKLDPNNPTVEYYLTILSMDRIKYKEAWNHLKCAKQITAARNHHPDCLKSLHHSLRCVYPRP